MPDRVDSFRTAAGIALALAARDEVAARWGESSALRGMTVGGLASHLCGQVMATAAALDQPVTTAPVTLDAHYAQVPWRGAALDSDVNAGIREGAESAAEAGHADVLAAAERALPGVAARLRALGPDDPVQPPWLRWSLRRDDYLRGRLLEFTVHTDDLAVSVGLDTPDQPPEVLEPVLALLTRLAVERHGQPAVVRALARAERAPATISAL